MTRFAPKIADHDFDFRALYPFLPSQHEQRLQLVLQTFALGLGFGFV